MRFVSSQKNKCLSPRKRYRENAYAAGSAMTTDMTVFIAT